MAKSANTLKDTTAIDPIAGDIVTSREVSNTPTDKSRDSIVPMRFNLPVGSYRLVDVTNPLSNVFFTREQTSALGIPLKADNKSGQLWLTPRSDYQVYKDAGGLYVITLTGRLSNPLFTQWAKDKGYLVPITQDEIAKAERA
jgi:hypothetical protein